MPAFTFLIVLTSIILLMVTDTISYGEGVISLLLLLVIDCLHDIRDKV